LAILAADQQISHYRIRAHIGQGSIGDVYRAEDSITGREVALKIPNKTTISDPRQWDYFQRELEAMCLLDHPTVQHGLGDGRDGNLPFLVTDFIAGQALSQYLKTRGALPVADALTLIHAITEGVAYCHANGVIHRDLKPDNILVNADGAPIIIDFSLALTPHHANAGSPAGTPEYVSPEQMRGQKGDERTDIYTLGIILYELLTGTPPFTGTDVMAVLEMRLYQPVPRLDQVRTDVPPSLATVVARCLQREPEARYPNARALLAALDDLESVDSGALAALTAPPPSQPFWKTQPGRALLTTLGFVAGIVLLTLVLIALKFLGKH